MRRHHIFYIWLILVIAIFSHLQAQDSTKTEDQKKDQNQVFIDENGDGYNDNAPDHDNDGIPNSLDPDWIKMKKEEKKKEARRFVDLDGDGIDDNLQKGEQARQRLGTEMNQNGGSMEQNKNQQKGQQRQNQNGKK